MVGNEEDIEVGEGGDDWSVEWGTVRIKMKYMWKSVLTAKRASVGRRCCCDFFFLVRKYHFPFDFNFVLKFYYINFISYIFN